MCRRHWLGALCLMYSLALDASGGVSVSAKTGARKVVIPLGLSADRRPDLVLKVEALHPECERRAFFRIGLLPLAVAEGVTFDFADVRPAANLLGQAQRRLATLSAARHLELRDLKLVVAGEAQPRLEAGKVQPDKSGQWQLTGGVTVHVAGARWTAPRGALQAAGPQAGEVTLDRDGTNAVLRILEVTPPPLRSSTPSQKP